MQPPSEFTLETSQPLNLAAFKSEIKVFRFKRTDFRLIFVHLPGPLSCASIVVPTICEDNKGLAHTLEHLVFCGSKSIPHRGYLDNLANRCLSTGTNAYTAQDHTCYEITTAGWQGMLNVFPTFLDHILHPTLKESQFTTEVYHLDHQAKHQGVVYCEMASREDTEADLLDMELRRLVYQNSTTYSHECGGLTEDIAKLSNKEIIEYHKQYYHLGVITAIITGDVRPDDLFKELLKHPELFDNAKDKIPEILSVHPPSSKNVPHELVSSRLKFASAEEDVGSIGFAWMGPASEDFKTIVAIDVLFRHLHETPASLLAQKFVETASPLASDIDFELKGHVDTCLCLIFSGVPFSKEANGDDQIGDGSTENSASGSDDGENSESPSVISERDDLFDENVFFNILKKCLTCWIDQGIPEPEGMLSTLKRHRQKVEEAFEEEPHEVVTNYIIADVIRYFLSEKSKDGDTRAQKGKPSFKGRSKVLDVIDELEKEPVQFWIDLAKKWLIDAPTYQVLMIPDAQMAIDKSASEIKKQKERQSSMGPAKLKKQGLLVADAVHDNRIDIPEHVVANMPPIPDASKAPTLKCECENIDMEQIDPEATISTFQLVRTETNFVHLGLGLDISGLLKTSRPYLVLFQELLFQCPMVIPCASGKVIKMDYKAVSTYSSDLFTSHEAGVGFGNGVWTTGWLSNVLTIFATCQRTDWERMIRFVTQVVCFTDFTSDRILTVAKNLLTQLTETKRDGDAMLSSMATHLSYYGEKENEGANDIAISIFQQEAFLKKVILDIESGKGKKANDDLKALQCRILQNLKGSRTFIRLGVPLNFSLRKNYSSSLKEIALDANDIWTSEHSKFPKSTSKRRKRAPLAVPVIFPFFRTPYQVETVDSRLSRSVALPIAGLSTCYLSQFIPCDILSPHPHPDFFPVTLLAEILSRTEGPIFTAVRGQGYAYGAGLSAYLWHGQLSYDVSKSSEPKKALLAFYEIVKELQTDSGIDRLCTKFDIETAQSSVAYRWVSERSSNGALLATSLRAALWGFSSLQEHAKHIELLYLVTKEDLLRVSKTWFSKFLSDERVTCLTTPTGDEAEKLIASFAASKDPRDCVKFKVITVGDFTV